MRDLDLLKSHVDDYSKERMIHAFELICDNYENEIKLLRQENNKQYEILSNLNFRLKCSIYSINEKLVMDKYFKCKKDGKEYRELNNIQRQRLKAYRTKCKEILKLINESDN